MTKKLSDTDGLVKTLELGDRGDWFEITSDEGVAAAAELTQTAIALYYKRESETEGGHPRRWFVLVNESNGKEIGDVCLAVEPDGVELKNPNLINGKSHVTGYQNKPPYPDFEFEISELSDAIGIEIEPNCMGRRIS
ncbi:hypothetical protein [Mesorhizobium sp. SP-1A]|uniref:hypothetical protein n=1 Tax=Mesorhizobium sp. SP-1A TaxID=3077840 RepID=UPI0028F71D5A|nr:hypothetical protein [Mesorhizobium sp. SP-1A]